jgi:hypothetical protein
VALSIRPRERCAVRVGGIACSEYDGIRFGWFGLMTPQPIDGAGQGELSRAQTLDEVSTATLT